MSSSPGVVTGNRFRHRIKDIKLDPFQSHCPIDLELVVGEKKPIKLPRIKAKEDLYWDLDSLPCDISPTSEVVLKVVEVHLRGDRHSLATYTMSDVIGKSALVRETRIGQPQKPSYSLLRFSSRQTTWTITLGFLDQKEIEAMYSKAIDKSSTAMQENGGPLDKLGINPDLVKTILGFGAVVAELHPIAKLVVALVTQTWGIIEKQQQLHDDMRRLITGLDRILPVVELINKYTQEEIVQGTIVKLLDLVEDASYFIKMYLSKPELARVMFGAIDGRPKERVDKLTADLEDLRKDLDTRMAAENLKHTLTREQTELIRSLHWKDQLEVSMSRKCQDGTRVDLLKKIFEWTGSQSTDEKLLWVKGDAGLGKSAIAGSVCREFESKGVLGSYFFCKRDDPKRRNPEIILNTLIYRLAKQYEPYGRLVAAEIEKHEELPNAAVDKLFEELIQKPLQSLKDDGTKPNNTHIVVVDALDECEQVASRRMLLSYLRELSLLVPWLKVLLVSRPDPDIELAYGSGSVGFVTTFKVREYDASGDIFAYIKTRMSTIVDDQQCHNFSDESCRLLSERANGLFIWAYTACQFIEDGNDMNADLQKILDGTQSASGTLHLDDLYTTAIERALGRREDNLRDVLWFLGVILATNTRTLLSMDGIRSLLEGVTIPASGQNNDLNPLLEGSVVPANDGNNGAQQLLVGSVTRASVDNIVRRLRSVLYEDVTMGGAVRVYHQSFTDYLAASHRSGRFFVDPNTQNDVFAHRCLDIMLRDLRFNICELKTSHVLNRDVPELKDRVQSTVNEELRYSCLHWSSHMVEGTGAAHLEVLDNFLLGPKLLYWMEVLSLLGELRVGLKTLQQVALWTPDSREERRECAYDAYRFLQSFYEAISESTPHLYVSALALAPEKCGIVQRMHKRYPNIMKVTKGGKEGWSRWSHIILHESEVYSVAISADGKYIASGSRDHTVRIWDAETGQPASAPLQGHSSWVRSVAFSSDGKRIVSGSSNNTVRIWNAETGQSASAPLQGHSGELLSVAFSSDGKRIVSGSDDKTVRIWDASTGQPASAPLQGHSGFVLSVAFSSDGKRIVSGSSDNTVRIWDAETGQLAFTPLQGHSGSVNSITSSSDCKSIVSGSLDNTTRAWNPEASLTSFSPPSCSLYSSFGLPYPSDYAGHTKLNPTSHPASKDSCLTGSQLVPCLLPGTGWVSLDSHILLWLPSECRQIDHSLIRISNAPLPSPLLLDISKFVHGDRWARIVG